MKLSKLKKLIKEEIQKLQEQDFVWDPNTDCSITPPFSNNPQDPIEISKICGFCNGVYAQEGQTPNEYGFYIDFNGCFCCKDYNKDGTPINEPLTTIFHWFGVFVYGSGENCGMDFNNNNFLVPILPMSSGAGLDGCIQGSTSPTTQACSEHSQEAYEALGSPSIGTSVPWLFQNMGTGNELLCIVYLGPQPMGEYDPSLNGTSYNTNAQDSYGPMYYPALDPSLSCECEEEIDPVVDPCDPKAFEVYVLNNFNSIDEFCDKCETGSLVDEKCDCCPPVPSTDGVMQGPKDKEDYLDAIGLGPNTFYKPKKPLKDFPIKPLQERLQKLAGIKKRG